MLRPTTNEVKIIMIFGFFNKGPNIIPAKKPPKWANHATPGEPGLEILALIICPKIQTPKSKIAGSLKKVINIPNGARFFSYKERLSINKSFSSSSKKISK